jgi:FkbM family methyltransferase
LHLLRDNIIANGLSDYIKPFSVALSNHCGLSRLYVQDLTPGAALHTESKDPISQTRTGHKVVAHEGIYALTLDAFVNDFLWAPTAMKVDVDGNEAEVMQGAHETLKGVRTILVEMEVERMKELPCRGLLVGASFKQVRADGNNQIWQKA